MQPTSYIVVLVTAPSQDAGRRIAAALLESRLAACVNILTSMQSMYRWEGNIQDEPETLLVIKTRAALFEPLQAAVRALHPYQVPEIIALPVVAGLEAYLHWIDEATA